MSSHPSSSIAPGISAAATNTEPEEKDDVTIGRGLHLPDAVLLEVERRSNDYFFDGHEKDAEPSSSIPSRTIEKDNEKRSGDVLLDFDRRSTDYVFSSEPEKKADPIEPLKPSTSSINPGTAVAATNTDELKDDGTAGRETASTTTMTDPNDSKGESDAPPGKSIYLSDAVLQAVEKRSNEYYFPPSPPPASKEAVRSPPLNAAPKHFPADDKTRADAVTVGPGIDLHSHEEASERTKPSNHVSGYNMPPLSSMDDYIFGPEDTDQRRSARLYQPVKLVETHSETLEIIRRPSALAQPPQDARRPSDPNIDVLFTELTKRTSPRVLVSDLPMNRTSPHDLLTGGGIPLDRSTPLSDAPKFSPADLHSLLKPSPSSSDSDHRGASAIDPTSTYKEPGTPPSLPFGQVYLFSAEEGVEKFDEAVVHPHQSRSLGADALSIDLPNILPSPVAQNYRTEGAFPQRRFITEETTTMTIEELLITKSSGQEAVLHHHYEQPSDVKLVAAADGSFKMPERWETYLSLEQPAEDDVNDEQAAAVTPRDLDVDAAELAYYRIAQEAAPSLESSGEFEGLPEGAAPRPMSIQEIMRLTDNCDQRRTSFGLDVISEESEAERSSRFEVRRPSAFSVDVDVEERLKTPEDASDVAARLLKNLSPTAEDENIDSEDEGEVAEWGQTSSTSPRATAEPFADDLSFEDEDDDGKKNFDEDDVGEKELFTIRDFVLTPDAGDVYDSDGLNPASYRAGVREHDYEAEWVIPSKSLDELELIEARAAFEENLERTTEAAPGAFRRESLPRDYLERMESIDRYRRASAAATLDDDVISLQRLSLEYIEQKAKEIVEEAIEKSLETQGRRVEYINDPIEFVEEHDYVNLPFHRRQASEADLDEDDVISYHRHASETDEEVISENGEEVAIPLSPIEESNEESPEPSNEETLIVLRKDDEMGSEVLIPRLDHLADQIEEEEVLDATLRGEVPAQHPDLSDVTDEKTSDDERQTSTSSSPHEDDGPETARGEKLPDDVIRAVEERSNEYYGFRKAAEVPSPSKAEDVHLVEAVDVLSRPGVISDNGEVRLIRSRDALRVEKEKVESEETKSGMEEGETSAEVEIRLEKNESMDSATEKEREVPLHHPTVIRLGVDSKQPSLDRQSSGASDDIDRSSLVRLKLENNLERATSSHGEREDELNTANVERFWEYRYNKSPRTMRELEEARRRAEREAQQRADGEIRARRREEEGAVLDAEINQKLAEAEDKFLQRDRQTVDSERLRSAPSSPRSSPSFVVDNLSQQEEEDDEENEPGLPLSSSGPFFHLRSSSSSSASTASFNSMGDGRQGRVKREPLRGGLTRERVGGASDRVGGVSSTELERLYPYIRHSSYYLHYYRDSNLSMEKQPASRNDYMFSRGLLRSSTTRDSFGIMRHSASTDYVNHDASDRKSVTFRQRIEELVHTPPTINKRIIRSGTAQIRSILKSQHASNLIKVANENMLRELEQCVEERDRLNVNISATPADISGLSPMTQSAQMRYRNHMLDQRERISTLIEDKYALIKETLREDDMPSWLRGKDDPSTITLVDYKRPHRRLLRRSSSFFYQQLQQLADPNKSRAGSKGADLVTANDCARKLERLRGQFARKDSSTELHLEENGDVLTRIYQRLSTSPNRMETAQ